MSKIVFVHMIIYLLIAAIWTSQLQARDNVLYQTDIALVPIGVGVLGLSLITAHMAAPPEYSVVRHTISHLGAQNYSNAWIMRTGFITFGATLSAASVWDMATSNRHLAQSIPLLVYGTSMAMTGFFSAEPFVSGTPYNQPEDDFHGFFAMTAGIALTTSIIASAIVEKRPIYRAVHVTAALFVPFASMMFQIMPEYQGLWQRALWAGGLAWVTFTFSEKGDLVFSTSKRF